MNTPTIRLGADRLVADHSLVPGSRWGLVTNYTGVTSDLTPTSVALVDGGAPLVALLSPEHGLRGIVQAGESDGSGTDPETGLPVVDTYGVSGAALDEAIDGLHLDALVVDIQDVGARFYTYVWTMVDCLTSAARLGLPFVVLDRPNPLGGTKVAGPGLVPGYESFVGRIDIPIRHGLTIGEIARVAAAQARARGEDVPDPTVITMEGWDRSMMWADTGLPWIMPSPNIPTADTALAYVGMALFEGTTMSEGRGTTRPFEIVGAPWLDHGFAAHLNTLGLPGVRFRAAWFAPTFYKWKDTPLGGVQLYVTDPDAFDPVMTACRMLVEARTLAPDDFAWREPEWEGDRMRPHFVDLLWGNSTLRALVDDSDLAGIAGEIDGARRLRERDEALLLYGRNTDG